MILFYVIFVSFRFTDSVDINDSLSRQLIDEKDSNFTESEKKSEPESSSKQNSNTKMWLFDQPKLTHQGNNITDSNYEICTYTFTLFLKTHPIYHAFKFLFKSAIYFNV